MSRSAGSGRAVAAALLAVVFLTVIGASVGYVLGAREARARAADGDTPTPGVTSTTPVQRSPGNQTSAPPGPRACLDHTEQLARDRGSPGGLTEVMYLLTTGSEVWICKDTGGRLWYQGHVRSAEEKAGGSRGPLIEGDNALFLSTVEREGEGYVATNTSGGGTTKYHVSVQELVIEFGDGRKERQDVVTARVGR